MKDKKLEDLEKELCDGRIWKPLYDSDLQPLLERLEKLKDRIDGNQAILTTNRQDIEKLETMMNNRHGIIMTIQDKIEKLESEKLADEHTLLHIRENKDAIEKFKEIVKNTFDVIDNELKLAHFRDDLHIHKEIASLKEQLHGWSSEQNDLVLAIRDIKDVVREFISAFRNNSDLTKLDPICDQLLKKLDGEKSVSSRNSIEDDATQDETDSSPSKEPTDEFDAQREEYVKEMFEGKYKLVKREDLKRWKQMGEEDLGYDIAEEIEKYLEESEETK